MYERVGPTDENRKLSPPSDIGDGFSGGPELSRGQLAPGRVDIAKEVVGNAEPIVNRNLVRGYVQTFVELHFVRVDDLKGEVRGEVDGKAGLSGAGGAHDDEEFVFIVTVAVAAEGDTGGGGGGGCGGGGVVHAGRPSSWGGGASGFGCRD
ncbi:LOW QUALITY PROTEIN: hypothetical protein PanWU01x14_018820 [Parasponia andersonii]|uniref:Uncharacterized protein n=1 Tax=Parasponia andersonii TaxID=3476 RepID=A0A2P5DZA0_PARAD|nr:LOW QUALITY PROTEIN: hypothetical protein PanWU01x14_018820 [Parasponia andersonii]